MAKIAVIIDDMFEDVEYSRPAEAFKKEGHELIHIGLEQGKFVRGKRQGTTVRIDVSVRDVSPDQFDALLIPGGYSPDHLRADEDAVTFTRKFLDSGKPIFSICHAPQLLISTDRIKGRKMTGWKSIIQDIKNAGAIYEDKEVVVDGNLISSRQPSDLSAFIEASLNKLH
jgi:protease I